METKEKNFLKKPVRVWMDGCFDLVHFGHANAMRLARALGDQLVVGVHSDSVVAENKGYPVFTEEERYKLIRSIKWVDEVVENVPYCVPSQIVEDHCCDFSVHGDDFALSADGTDPYKEMKDLGKYKIIKRTEGVSTTDLVFRILKRIEESEEQSKASMNKSSQAAGDQENRSTKDNKTENNLSTTVPVKDDFGSSIWTTGGMYYMPNILRISQFCQDRFHEPTSDDTVVYVPGTFDLFHIGHLTFLEECLKLGNYILIGLYSDKNAHYENGRFGSILTLHERLLSVLACRYVHNVIIDAPYVITPGLLKQFKVNYVAVGWDKLMTPTSDGVDPVKICKELDILRYVQSNSTVTTLEIIERIRKRKSEYIVRNEEKEAKEMAYFNSQQQCNSQCD